MTEDGAAFDAWWATMPLLPCVSDQVKGLCLLAWMTAAQSNEPLRIFARKVATYSNDSWLAREADALVPNVTDTTYHLDDLDDPR